MALEPDLILKQQVDFSEPVKVVSELNQVDSVSSQLKAKVRLEQVADLVRLLQVNLEPPLDWEVGVSSVPNHKV